MKRVCVLLTFLGALCASPASARPVDLQRWNTAVHMVRTAPQLRLDVTRSDGTRFIVDHVAAHGQRVERRLNGSVISAGVTMWAAPYTAGGAVSLLGYLEWRPSRPECWTVWAYASPYRPETSTFGGLVSSDERDQLLAPALTVDQVRRVHTKRKGVVKLRIERTVDGREVTGHLEVDKQTNTPLRLITRASTVQDAQIKFATSWVPAPPGPQCQGSI